MVSHVECCVTELPEVEDGYRLMVFILVHGKVFFIMSHKSQIQLLLKIVLN
jgi:hypothetical protein